MKKAEKQKENIVRKSFVMRENAEKWLENDYMVSIKADLQRGRKMLAGFKNDILAIEQYFNESEELKKFLGEYITKAMQSMFTYMRRSISYEKFYKDMDLSKISNDICKVSNTIINTIQGVYNAAASVI